MQARTTPRASIEAWAQSVIVFACAASAGAHAGLVPLHLRTEPRLGFAFMLAVALLLTTGVAAAVRPADRRVGITAALLFAGLIAAYTATRTTGIPLLSPDPEEVDAVGVATNLVEVLGLVAASLLVHTSRQEHGRLLTQEVPR